MHGYRASARQEWPPLQHGVEVSFQRRVGTCEALRFKRGGPAFGANVGPIWFDRDDGNILEARLGVPNHAEYHDFHPRLLGLDDRGSAAWQELLRVHVAGCPAK
ncbi:MAG: hypothetical protein H7099_02775 [Gemmatimonadaceae bacterium]|nr:hypothetical protein [Gemmatimonadaceae bacterium]